MQIMSGNLQMPAGVYKATHRHSHTVSAVRNFWPSATRGAKNLGGGTPWPHAGYGPEKVYLFLKFLCEFIIKFTRVFINLFLSTEIFLVYAKCFTFLQKQLKINKNFSYF